MNSDSNSHELFYLSFLKVVIYDEIGRKVKQGYSQKLYIGENTIELNIADYRAGIYFVSLEIGNKIVVEQIIKK